DEDAGQSRGRRREGARVGELPSEVQPAHEAEDLTERSAAPGLDAAREIESGAGAQDHLRAGSTAIGGREQEDAVWTHPFGSIRLRCAACACAPHAPASGAL